MADIKEKFEEFKDAGDPEKKLEKITDKADDKKDKAAGKAADLEAKATEDQVELNERFGRQLDLDD